MSTLATLILWVVMAGSAMVGIGIVVHKHDNGVREAALAPWKPLTTYCESTKLTPTQCAEQWTTLKTANVILKGDFKRLDDERKQCSDNTKKLGDETKDTLAAKDKQIKAKQKAVNDLQAQLDLIDAELAGPPTAGDSCEVTLQKITDADDKLGARRLRDYPPKPAGADARGQPAPAAGAGADTLRITH